MSWFASFGVAVLTAIIGTCLAGVLAGACVKWYHVSSFEGQSGYFVVVLALLGGLVSFFGSLLISRLLADGFWKALGYSNGAVIGVIAVIGAISWLLADIAPEIDSHELQLEVEVRLPKGAPDPTGVSDAESVLTLGSINMNHVQRKSERGHLFPSHARQEDGRWIVPGSVFVFTTRGVRSIAFQMGKEDLGGFIVPLPARPGRRDQEWTRWMPVQQEGGTPWPDTKVSYRCRVQQILPLPPPRDPADVEAEAFAALRPEAPLSQWLGFLKYEMPDDRRQAILRVATERPDELAQVVRSENPQESDPAMDALELMSSFAPPVIQAMQDVAEKMSEEIRTVNKMKEEDAGYVDLSAKIRDRFSRWHRAWWKVHQVTQIDGKPPLRQILDLASANVANGHLREVALEARVHLEGMKP